MNAPPQQEPRSWWRRHWGVRLLGVISLTLVFLWWAGLPAQLARIYADHLVSHQRLLHADVWYQTAASWGEDSQELWFSRARLARMLSREEDFALFLGAAKKRGLSLPRLRLEVMLAQAQRGNLDSLRSALSDLLVKGDDADEICFAYVQGSMIKYYLDDAMRMLELWESDYPNDPRPNLLRGRLLEHGSNLDAAKLEFLKALEKNSNYSAAAFNMGRILETEQSPAEALRYYRITAETLLNPVPGLVAVARCLRLTQQYEQAQLALQQAAEASTDQDVEAFRLLGDPAEGAAANLLIERGYLAATMDNHEESARFFREALDISPNNWRARYQLAVSLRQIGEEAAALEQFAKVNETKEALTTCDRLFDKLSKEPNSIEARLQIGKIFLDYLSPNQGVVWLNSVLDLDPDNVEAHQALAEYFRRRENEDPALRELAESHEAFLPDK